MINETSMRCFLSLAQTLSFTKTARELFMTQQSVSQHIAKMEAGLGFPLFVRSRHFVALTQAGQQYYTFFSDVSERYQELYHDCLARYTTLSRSLNVGYQNWIYLGHAANWAMDELWRQMPGVEIEITRRSPGLLVHKLKKHELQLVVMYGRWAPRAEGIRIAKLMDLEVVLLVSPDNPLATEGATFQDFAHEPFLIDSFEHESTVEANRRIRREMNMMAFSPSRITIMPDREAAYTAAELGQGVVLSSNLSLIMKSGHLKIYPTGIKESLVCVWHADDENAAVGLYAKCLQNAYRDIHATSLLDQES